ncbi:hypothetical protein QF000_001705 [Paraburkholderia atlantica]
MRNVRGCTDFVVIGGGVQAGVDSIIQPGGPWVVCGLHSSQLNNVISLRVVWLRNQ